MWRLDGIIVPAVLILGISCFVWMVRSKTRGAIRNSHHTVESMYPLYADPIRKQPKYARKHAPRGATTRAARRPDHAREIVGLPCQSAGQGKTVSVGHWRRHRLVLVSYTLPGASTGLGRTTRLNTSENPCAA
jgi:hypothetical protein